MDAREMYTRWLDLFARDKALVAELEAVKDDEAEIEERFHAPLSFGTAGMRGILGMGTNRMNVYVVRQATQGLAEHIVSQKEEARGVAIAYDSRQMSKEFALEAALVLCQNGVKTYLFDDLRPVPVLSFTIRHLNAAAGIVITASHNPMQYNGFKAYGDDGGQLAPEPAAVVEKNIRAVAIESVKVMDKAEALAKGLLFIIGEELDAAYQSYLKTLCLRPALVKEMAASLCIVYTPLHGSGNKPVRRALLELGYENVHVVEKQTTPDGTFPTLRVPPNPENPAAFELALEEAKNHRADIIIATDPDADRVGVAVKDHEGHDVLLSGNQIGCLLMDYVLKTRRELGTLPKDAAVIKSIVSTQMANAIAAHFGVAIYEVLTGFKFIAEKMAWFEESQKHTFVFGYEESFGFLSGTKVRDKDAVNASVLLAEVAAYYKKQGKTLYDGLLELYQTYGYYEDDVYSIVLEGVDGLAKMKALMDGLRAHPPAAFAGARVTAVRDYLLGERAARATGEVTTLDMASSNVLFYELEDGGWVVIRPSGTEPKIKVYFNAVDDDKQKAKAKVAARKAAMLERVGV